MLVSTVCCAILSAVTKLWTSSIFLLPSKIRKGKKQKKNYNERNQRERNGKCEGEREREREIVRASCDSSIE